MIGPLPPPPLFLVGLLAEGLFFAASLSVQNPLNDQEKGKDSALRVQSHNDYGKLCPTSEYIRYTIQACGTYIRL